MTRQQAAEAQNQLCEKVAKKTPETADYYRNLLVMQDQIQDCLNCADADGIDLKTLELG